MTVAFLHMKIKQNLSSFKINIIPKGNSSLICKKKSKIYDSKYSWTTYWKNPFRHVTRCWIKIELCGIYQQKIRRKIDGCISYAANKSTLAAINLRITCCHLRFHNPVYFWLSSQVQLSERMDREGVKMEERRSRSTTKNGKPQTIVMLSCISCWPTIFAFFLLFCPIL